MANHSQVMIDNMSADELIRFGYVGTIGERALEELQGRVDESIEQCDELDEENNKLDREYDRACQERDEALDYLEAAVRIIKDIEGHVGESDQHDIDGFLSRVVNDESLPNWRFDA